MKGHGAWDNDRRPVAGVVGRESGEIRLAVCHHRDRETLQPFIEGRTPGAASVYTDQGQAYNYLPETGRAHAGVCYSPANGSGHEVTLAMVCVKRTALLWKA